MTLDEALARDRPVEGRRVATGTDGDRWFWTFRGGGRDWTREAYEEERVILTRAAELDPPGVDWAPGIVPLSPPEPAPPPAPHIPAPCQCEACRRRGETQ